MSAALRKLLRKHVIAFACYRGAEDDLLREAYKDVLDPAGRGVLLAVFAIAILLNEAAYYQKHSALADDDVPKQAAQAQIREARENRDKVLNNIVDRLRLEVPTHAEQPLAMFAAGGGASKGGLAVERLVSLACSVAAIRELLDLGDEPL